MAAGIGALSVADALTATGLPDPGPATTLGVPFVRAAGEIAAAVAVGGFLCAAFLVPPQPSGVLDASGYRALRLARAASAGWAACAVLMVPLTVSDVSGKPLREHLHPAEIWRVAGLVDTANAWRWTAALALAVTLAAAPVLRWSATPVLLGGSLITLLPLVLTGHSAAGGSHDLATDSLLIHLVAGSLWAGGLLSLLAVALRGADHTALAARRFSALALWCFLAMALSGGVNALVRIRPADLVGTAYGNLLLAKVAALGVLAAIGWFQRRAAVAALQGDPTARGPLVRLGLTEAMVFGLTFGVAVGLGRTPPPPPGGRAPSPAEVALGYPLAGPPTPARLLLDWRPDLLFAAAAILAAGSYLVGVGRVRRRGEAWPLARTAAWLLGCAVLVLATCSGLGRYGPATFSVHTTTQVLLAVVAPPLLVSGAPAVLALRVLPRAGAGPPGAREWLQSLLRSRPIGLLTHPAVATVVFLTAFCAVFTAGVFDATVGSHAAHVVMKALFVISGCLFLAAVLGARPGVGAMASAAVLVAVTFSAAVLAGSTRILGERFYRSLAVPWDTDLLGDQHLGAVIAGAAGVVPVLVVLTATAVRRRGAR